jgi:uncharacterized membrane protein YeiB
VDLSPTATASLRHGPTERLRGPDVVRAVALIGVVAMNYHGYLILRGAEPGSGWFADLFDPFRGPMSTRFAATFVVVAGVGVSLLTRSTVARDDRDEIVEMRWRLVRRGTLLYVVGLVLDEAWPGTILPFYGAMFVLSAAVFTLRTRWIAAIGVTAVLAAWALRAWQFRHVDDGGSIEWMSPGPGILRGYVFEVGINGTHPLLPWFGFLCAGIVLGRVVVAVRPEIWRPAVVGAGFVSFALATIVNTAATTPFTIEMLSVDSTERGLVYVASALGTALIAYALIDAIANRWPAATEPLRCAGQMTLTLYLLHVVVFYAVVEWVPLVDPAGVGTALVLAVGYWIAAIAAATWWTRHVGLGPAERVYRAFGG